MICTLMRDDMPLLSQWIKKSKSEDLDFLVGVTGSTVCSAYYLLVDRTLRVQYPTSHHSLKTVPRTVFLTLRAFSGSSPYSIKKARMQKCTLAFLVGVTGLEPAASKSQTSRATNCATPRYNIKLFYAVVRCASCCNWGSVCARIAHLPIAKLRHSFFLASSAPGGARKRPQLRHTPIAILSFKLNDYNIKPHYCQY